MALQLWDPNQDLINQMSGTQTPKYNPVDLDQGTKGLIQSSVDRASQPYKSSDIDKSASMFMPKGPSQGQMNSGLLSAPGAGNAIANKYAQIAGEKLQGMKADQGRSDKEHEFARTGMAFNNAMQQQQVQNQNYEAYLQQIKNEQQVRAQTLNTMLGGGASIAGGAIGGAGSRGKLSSNASGLNSAGGGGASLGPDYLGTHSSISSLGGD